MITLPVFDRTGKEVDSLTVDEAVFGGCVRYDLLKQALVMYHSNKHIGTAATKNRSLVAGSTRKLYKQKGTGNARAGTLRTPVRKGGGVTFAKEARSRRKDMPQKQKQLAKNSAILAKLQSGGVVVVTDLNFDSPKTKDFSGVLSNLKIERSCLVAMAGDNRNTYLSLRNIPKINMMRVEQLNAGDICNHQKLLMTKDAFEQLIKVEND